MSAATYICEVCGGAFLRALTDEQARAQFADEFPLSEQFGDEVGTACEDCYREIAAWIESMGGEEAARAWSLAHDAP